MAGELVNGRYALQRRLGGGAEGRVYLVRDRAAADAPRALKLLAGAGGAGRAGLTAEFRRLARLDHPAVVRVHDLDELVAPALGAPVGTPFFTSAFVDGLPIDRVLGRGGDRVEALIRAAEDVAAGLAHLHAHGLLHCDVKPDNVLLGAGGAVLVDLGLAGAAGAGRARGTLAFMPPEALAARPEPRSDLYGLGATLYRVIAGSLPFAGDAEAVRRALASGRRPALAGAGHDVPPPLVELVDRLLAPEPDDRPSSAAVVLSELARIREALDLAPRRLQASAAPLTPARLVGRDDQIAALTGLLAALGAGRAAPAVVELLGPSGSGRRAIAERAVRRVQVAAATGGGPAPEVVRGSFERLAGGAEDPAGVCDALAARAAVRPLAVLLEDAGEPRARLLCREVAGRAPRGLLLLRIADAPALAASVARRIAVPPLSAVEIAALAGELLAAPVPGPFADELARLSGGLPRIAIEILREVAARGGVASSPPLASLVGGVGDFAALCVQRAAALPRALRELVEALAVLGGPASEELVAATAGVEVADAAAALAELDARGFARRDGDEVALPSPAHTEALAGALPEARARALHRAALVWYRARGEDDPTLLARHVLAVGSAAEAAQTAAAAAEELARRAQAPEALALARAAAERAAGVEAGRCAALWAERAVAVGAYEEAGRAAERALRSRQPEVKRRGLLAAARAAQKRGELERADELLGRLLDLEPEDAEALGARARLLVARGRYRDALALAADGAAPAPLLLEAAGLAELYLGDRAAASARFAELERRAREDGDRPVRARALALAGMAAQSGGDVAGAAARYAEASTEARRAGDLHASAVYDLNRATAESHRGRHGAALLALDDALPELSHRGSPAERAAALFNRGNALLAVGELDAAARAAERAREVAEAHGDRSMPIYARLLAGDVRRRRGDPAAAATLCEQALALAEDAQLAEAAAAARLNLAEARAELGDRGALALLADADAHGDAGARLAIGRGRIALAVGGDPAQAAAPLGPLVDRLCGDQSFDLAWRAAVVAARLERAAGDTERAAALGARARAIVEELVADTPEQWRGGLRRDPDAQALAALEADLAVSSPATPAAGSAREERLRRLLALGRRLNSELRLAPLLDDVLDTAIELARAERGFLLLARGEDELDVVVARGIDRAQLGDEAISRSIAERAARTGETIVTLDAELDERWQGAASVAAMQLRSVLAVPLRVKSRLVGTIYLDHRFRRAVFDDDAVSLLAEVADLAAVAIHNARLVEDNRRRQEEIAALSRRLASELDRATVELAETRARLPAGERRAGPGFPGIVGQSPAMLDLFASLERAARAELPVVVTGESGTGKELVARALHQSGPRAERAFVAVNCGAVPDPLLESELFGHVRGAFTGADRERRGLFEVADGGTLFLDEIADTSQAMQTKLLRVLQEGEIRRLGDERTRRVDVRVVAATNRGLAGLVEAGAFREDLFYRINVLELTVPPLRDRVEDLPALAEHLLVRLAGDGPPPTLSKAALGVLSAHAWPGNVRELENELARAAAMADEVIEARHLSPRLSAAAARRPSRSGQLELKPQVEALERSLVEQAMERTGGNQSRAAELLGLSRYGLQKKLKRYGLSAAD